MANVEDELLAAAVADFPDNTTGDITPQRLRDFNIAFIVAAFSTFTATIMFNEPGTLTAGEEMRMGNTEGQNNEGWVVPFKGKLVRMTISRGDSDSAELDVTVNGVVQATVPTAALKSVETIDIDVEEGDSVMVLGGASTPNAMTQPVVVLAYYRVLTT